MYYCINNFCYFIYFSSLVKIREFIIPTQVNSVSVHPDCTMFVCSGEDLKMYKFDYASGVEIGKLFIVKFRR